MRRSQFAMFIGFTLATTTLVAADSPSSSATVRYRTDSFKVGPAVPTANPMMSSPTDGSNVPRGQSARRVQHSELGPGQRSRRSIEFAQADLLDDLLDMPPQTVAPDSDLEGVLQEIAPSTPEAEAAPPAPPTGAANLPAGQSVGPTSGTAGRPIVTPTPGVVSPERRRKTSNQPYTLGGILDDEEDPSECLCEQLFCEQMWECAGGRSIGWFKRWKRNAARDARIRRGQAHCLPNPMQNWECPYRQPGGQPGGPGYPPVPSTYGGPWTDLPPGSTPVYQGNWDWDGAPGDTVGPVGSPPQSRYLEASH